MFFSVYSKPLTFGKDSDVISVNSCLSGTFTSLVTSYLDGWADMMMSFRK